MTDHTQRCKWKDPQSKLYECTEQAWCSSEQGYCIFHERSTEKDNEAFNAGIQAKLNNHDFDFTGYYFPAPMNSFRGFTFDGDVFFRLAEFQGSLTDFSKASFRGSYTDFREAKFFGETTLFTQASFASENTYFNNADFSSQKGTSFEDAEFLGPVSFLTCTFSGTSVNFSHAKFRGSDTIFNGTTLSGENTDFSTAEFAGERAYFNSVRFLAKVTTFANARFTNTTAGFIDALFGGRRLSFKSAWFMGTKTDFGGASFGTDATDFSWSNFSGESTHFGHATFSGEIVDFTHAHFSATETGFNDVAFACAKADFGAARFLSAWTDFTDTEAGTCSFVHARWRNVDFTGANWNSKPGRPSVSWDESTAGTIEAYRNAAAVCRNIKQAYQATGDYQAAREFFYGEMECVRRSTQLSPKWLGLTLLKLICGYGERPWRVVVTWLGVVIVFAGVYGFTGISTTTDVSPRSLFSSVPLREIAAHLWRCVYFSGVTFTTLGYGDFRPAGIPTQVFAVLEASLGAFLMALFILVVGRKLLR